MFEDAVVIHLKEGFEIFINSNKCVNKAFKASFLFLFLFAQNFT